MEWAGEMRWDAMRKNAMERQIGMVVGWDGKE